MTKNLDHEHENSFSSSNIRRSDGTKMLRVELQPPSEILLEGFILSAAIRFCLHTDANSRSLCSHLSSSLPFNPFLAAQPSSSASLHPSFVMLLTFLFRSLCLSLSPLQLDVSLTALPLCCSCRLRLSVPSCCYSIRQLAAEGERAARSLALPLARCPGRVVPLLTKR